jgi:hypothetical protein
MIKMKRSKGKRSGSRRYLQKEHKATIFKGLQVFRCARQGDDGEAGSIGGVDGAARQRRGKKKAKREKRRDAWAWWAGRVGGSGAMAVSESEARRVAWYGGGVAARGRRSEKGWKESRSVRVSPLFRA